MARNVGFLETFPILAALPTSSGSGRIVTLSTDGHPYFDHTTGWRLLDAQPPAVPGDMLKSVYDANNDGKIDTGALGTGTPMPSTILRGDGTWSTVGASPTGGGTWATLTTPILGTPRFFNRARTERLIVSTPTGRAMREIGNICYDPTSSTPYRMYTGAFTPPYSETIQVDTYIATSLDGRAWTLNPTPIITVKSLEDSYVIKTPQGWELYAEDKTAIPQKLMALFRSADGITGWTYIGNAGIPSVPSTFSAVDVSSPIMWMDGTRRYCLYEGRAVGQDGAIGLAYYDGTDPTQPWTVANGGAPVATGLNTAFFGAGQVPTVAWSSILVPDDLIKAEGAYWMLCHGYTIPDNRFVPILLTSPDLINWFDVVGSELINPDSAPAPGETWMWGDPHGASVYFTSDTQATAQTSNAGIKLARVRFEQTYGNMFKSTYDPNNTGIVYDSARLNGVLAASFLQKDLATQTVTSEITFNKNGRNIVFQRTSSGKQWHFDVGATGLFGMIETGVADALVVDPGSRSVSIYGAVLQTTPALVSSTQTASFTAVCSAARTVYFVSAAAAPLTATLPDATLAINQNRIITVKKKDATSNGVTITPVEGVSIVLSTPGTSYDLISDGTLWQVI